MPVSAPTDPVTLNDLDLPQNLVDQAKQLVAAAGITDPGIANDAALDYLATGDPDFITAAANIQQQVGITTAAVVNASAPAAAIGVAATAAKVTEVASGPTAVTFTAYITAAQSTDTTVNYTRQHAGRRLSRRLRLRRHLAVGLGGDCGWTDQRAHYDQRAAGRARHRPQ